MPEQEDQQSAAEVAASIEQMQAKVSTMKGRKYAKARKKINKRIAKAKVKLQLLRLAASAMKKKPQNDVEAGGWSLLVPSRGGARRSVPASGD